MFETVETGEDGPLKWQMNMHDIEALFTVFILIFHFTGRHFLSRIWCTPPSAHLTRLENRSETTE